MSQKIYNVLVLCTGNSCRSVMGEALVTHLGGGRFRAYSAGSHPIGRINQGALATLERHGLPTEGYSSKSWESLEGIEFDILIAVCDSAAGETCPVYLSQALRANWGVQDPGHVTGTPEEIIAAFDEAFAILRHRIQRLVDLPLDELTRDDIAVELDQIALKDGKDSAKEERTDFREDLTPTRGTEPSTAQPLSIFERYLTVWVLFCILAGVLIGRWMPQTIRSLAHLEISEVNLPVAVLIWLMVIPMLVRVDLGALHELRHHLRGISVTLLVNWLVKPFSMAFLAWVFIRHAFSDYLPSEQIDSYISGLILLAAAPCTAMVFVWSRLCNGDPLFTLSQVALNDTIMVFAFAPIVGLLLGLSAIVVPWATLLTSVLIYIVIPVLIAQWIRYIFSKQGEQPLNRFLERTAPVSILALLFTLILLFAFQGEAIIRQPIVIGLLAVPILIQVLFTSALAYGLNRLMAETHSIAGPSALIGASNFFELAVATAISLFGFESGAALATVVGVLIEVPLMLLVVNWVTATKSWYERGLHTQ